MACGKQKVKGGHGSITAWSSASCSASCSASIITLNLGVGCAPSCWGFWDSDPPGCSQGRRGQFSVQFDNRFSGRGGGVGSPPRAWRRVRVPGAAGAKKKSVRLASVFPSPPFGLPTSQGRGGLGSMDSTLALGAFRIARDAGGEAGREREPRGAGEGGRLGSGDCVPNAYPKCPAESERRHGA